MVIIKSYLNIKTLLYLMVRKQSICSGEAQVIPASQSVAWLGPDMMVRRCFSWVKNAVQATEPFLLNDRRWYERLGPS